MLIYKGPIPAPTNRTKLISTDIAEYPLVFFVEVTLLQHDHQELGVRGHENLVTAGPGPKEGHLVGGVQVPDHGLGRECELGDKMLILRQRGMRVMSKDPMT